MTGRGAPAATTGGRGSTPATALGDSPAAVGGGASAPSSAAGGRGAGAAASAAPAPAGRGAGRGVTTGTESISRGVEQLTVGGAGQSTSSATAAAAAPQQQQAPPPVAEAGKLLGKLRISDKSVPRITGEAGVPVKCATNHYRFKVTKPDGMIYKYVLTYIPDIGGSTMRLNLLRAALREHFGRDVPTLFEFMHVYTVDALRQDELKVMHQGREHRIIAKKVEQFATKDMPMNVLNLVVSQCERKMGLVQIGFNNFDPEKKVQLHDQYRDMSMWLGYKTAVLMRDAGPLLEVELCFKVVPSKNIYQQWKEFGTTQQGRQSQDPKRDFENNIKGRIAMATHNNRTYRIDGIVWNARPTQTFKRRVPNSNQQVDVKFSDYFKSQHGIDLNPEQFMLTFTDPRQQIIEQQRQRAQRAGADATAGAAAGPGGRNGSSSSSSGSDHGRTASGDSGTGGAGVADVHLIPPEVLVVTGLTDHMRKDFMLMRQMITIAQILPDDRVKRANEYLTRLKGADSYAQLQAFGVNIEDSIQRIMARQLPAPQIVFNERTRATASTGEFDRQLKECKKLLLPMPMTKWIIVYFGGGARGGDLGLGQQLGQELMTLGQNRFGMQIAAPTFLEVPSTRVMDLRTILQSAQKVQPEMVVLIMPTKRDDYYSEFKQIMCRANERFGGPIPSQAVLSKTLDPKKFQGVCVKLLWQINCKMGGSLWHVAMPKLPKNTMVVGIDVYHGLTGESREAVVGVVASLDEFVTKYKSKVATQGAHEEVSTILFGAISEAINAYEAARQTLPDNIIVFRDGVSDGQLEMVQDMEVNHIAKGLKRAYADRNRQMPALFYCVVQKRINMRIFSDQGNRVGNPPTGTVVDHHVTRQDLNDFYIVPQASKQGTVAPTHVIVLAEPKEFVGGNAADMLQSVAYNLTFNYANWPGAVRVPSPVQYAHKLVSLVGQTLRKALPDERLSEKLYYL